MNAAFTAEKRILSQAKADYVSGQDGLSRWFTNKYKLPANHELYLGRSQAEMMREMYADLFHERALLRATIRSVDGSNISSSAKGREKRALIAQLNALNDSLGEPREADDPLLDELEAALERGEEIDLSRLAPKPRNKA